MNSFSKQKSARIEWIDFGKGLTVLMVVFGHVVLGLFESKRFEDNNQWLLFVTQIFYLFHIPVFYALSGFFFKPVANLKTFATFVKQKNNYFRNSLFVLFCPTVWSSKIRRSDSEECSFFLGFVKYLSDASWSILVSLCSLVDLPGCCLPFYLDQILS